MSPLPPAPQPYATQRPGSPGSHSGPSRTGGAAGRWLAATAGLAFAAVGVALVSQHRFGMEPCPWCVLQRLLFLLIGVFALIGLVARAGLAVRVTVPLVLVVAASGVAAALWQHFVAAQTASCKLTLADRIMNTSRFNEWLPDVFEARASCADAAVDLLGIPYAFWAAAMFLICAALAVRAWQLARR